MAGIGNNLYPPIVPTYMPAFVRTTPCKVYFSLSDYNSASEIKNVQVMVSNQNSSLSALDSGQYPADIKITDLRSEIDEHGLTQYYVTISPDDLKDGIFEVGQYYKVQLRFTGIDAADITDSKKIAGWLTDNQAYFSEWSTVCLIKGIELPHIYLKGFENDSNSTVFTSEVVDLVGELYYTENADIEDEYLKSYTINIYELNTSNLLYTSGVVYTNEFCPNEINYTLKTNLESATYYDMEFIFTTSNEYTGSFLYTFSIMSAGLETLDATITATPDEENGRICIEIQSTTTSAFLGNVCIRRSSSEDDFTIWEDIKIETVTDRNPLSLVWYDYTVKSGVYYNYCAQKIDVRGHRGPIIQIRYPVMINLDDMFLTRDGMQLRVRYDPTISSFKKTVNESKTDTLGSQYPYIRRNGAVFYKQFPISGLITEFCDSDRLFSSAEEFYGDYAQEYEDYNEEYQITEYKDFFFEREFREKIIDFLYDNNALLFRSTPEGNVLVRLMDISFTPNQTLGRMLYSFSATAYEIDECSIDNYNKYGILDTGEYATYLEYTYSIRGQLDDVYEADQEIMNLIQNRYTTTASEGFEDVVRYLDWVRIDFKSDPYLIVCGSDGSLRPATADDEINENVTLGYIVYINGEPILVSPRGYYEIINEDVYITSIYFPVETEATIDYEACMDEEEQMELVASQLYWYIKPGQVWGTFDTETSVVQDLYAKYYLDYDAYYRQLASVDRITVQTRPGAIVYVKDSFDDDFYRHEVGPTGILDFYDDEATIMDFYFCGVQLHPQQDPERVECRANEFYETGEEYSDFSDITNPIYHGVYTVDTTDSYIPVRDFTDGVITVDEDYTTFSETNNEYTLILQELIVNAYDRWIWYDDEWYLMTDDNVVLCPVEGLVDYIFEVIKGEY